MRLLEKAEAAVYFAAPPAEQATDSRAHAHLTKPNMNTVATASPTSTHDTKESWIAYILWFFLGWMGGHKFYLGKAGWGIVYLLTGGIFLVGLLIDLFSLPTQVRNYNQGLRGGCWR